ncbi:MAG: hypothetical protein IKB64_08930 [Paludibacteraceae bacterium]|nr:hypothetical protein [Paludibacteraceae bacterium]MBR6641244.1 hypothetical protein [Clostridia bacterium]
MKNIIDKITTKLNSIEQKKRIYYVITFILLSIGLFTLDCYIGTLYKENDLNEFRTRINNIEQPFDSLTTK